MKDVYAKLGLNYTIYNLLDFDTAEFNLENIRNDKKFVFFPRSEVGVYVSVLSGTVEYTILDGLTNISSGKFSPVCFSGLHCSTKHKVKFTSKDSATFRVFFSDRPLRDLFYNSYQWEKEQQRRLEEKKLHENDIDDEIITVSVGRLLYGIEFKVREYCFQNDVDLEILSNKGILSGQFCFKVKGKKKNIDEIRNYFRPGYV